MRIGEGVEWALHCCTLLAVVPAGHTLPAAKLAEFHAVPPAYLAKHLQALSRAGLVDSVPGPRGGYRLARPAHQITVLDVVQAIDGDEPVFRCTEIRQRGPTALEPAAYPKPCGIARAMAAAEEAWKAELRSRTIADLVDTVAREADPRALATGTVWLQQSVR